MLSALSRVMQNHHGKLASILPQHLLIAPTDTIIIGAGISGLSCASRLFENPYYKESNRLLLLEARNRVGGRIASVEVNGARLDTGANWIHGTGTKSNPNPLTKILPNKRWRSLKGSAAFQILENGERSSQIIPSKSAATLYESLWSLIGSLQDVAAETPLKEAKDTTILSAISKSEEFRSAFEKLPKEYHNTFSSMIQFIENMEAAPLTPSSAESPKGRAGMGLLEYAIEDFEGEQGFLQDGYTPVVEEVAKDLLALDRIKLDTAVQMIDWSSNPIEVQTSSGETYSANKVICTLPLGVLQHASSASLFQPTLPTKKQEALSSIGFGTLDKIFLVYSSPWWEQEPFSSLLASGHTSQSKDPPPPDSIMLFTPSLPGTKILSDGTASPGSKNVSVINMQNLTGYPVLCCFVSCSTAQKVESLSDSDAGTLVHEALTNSFGFEPPKPEAVHVTRWHQDKLSRGSYSHMIAGLTEPRHRDELAKPLKNGEGAELRFAGEHTSRDHFATAHGALLSGWREADEILRQHEDR